MPHAKPKTSPLAIAALILAVMCGPIGAIVGIIALLRIKKSDGEIGGEGIAIASIVVSVGFFFIAGILAAIAIPNFVRYKLRSQQAEAKITLSQIRTAQESFRLESNGYVAAAPAGGGQAADPGAWTAAPCAASCPTDPSTCTSFACLGVDSGPTTFFTYACTTANGAEPEFTCAAVGDLDGDGDASVFVVGSDNAGAGTLGAPLPGIAKAAGCRAVRIPPGEVTNCTMQAF